MNWQLLIRDLRRGMSVTEIAEATGATVSGISNIAQGLTKEPRGTLALALAALAQERGCPIPGAPELHPPADKAA